MRWNGARDYLRQRMQGAAATPRLPAVRCPPRRPHTHASRFLRSVVGGLRPDAPVRATGGANRPLGCRADARADREPQPRRGRGHQAQADRRVRRPREHRRGAPERRAHALAPGLGRARPAPRLRRVDARPRRHPERRARGGRDRGPRRARRSSSAAASGCSYSTPYPGGAEYVAVCLPAFSPDTVHRDDDGA